MWVYTNVLRHEVGSPELDLENPIFYARSGIRILTISTEKFHSDFVKFDAFGVQEYHDMM
jgi:hypothetical protein